MASGIKKLLDETGWRLLEELQRNARLTYSELGNRLGLSSPAVSERIRKMEKAGIITGYHAELNLTKLGLPVLAVIQLKQIGGQTCENAVSEVGRIAEVVECSRSTEDDSILVKVVAASVDHLAKIIDRLSGHGVPSCTIARQPTLKRQPAIRKILLRGAPDTPNADIAR